MLNRPGIGNGKHLSDQLREQLKQLEEKEEMEELERMEREEQEQKTASQGAPFIWPNRFEPHVRAVLGKAIKEARERQSITQNQLERFCDFNVGKMSSIENGACATFDKAVLNKMGHHLKVDLIGMVTNLCRENRPAVIADTGMLLEDREQTFKIKGPHFELRCTMDSHTFKLCSIQNSIEIQIYAGKLERNHLFLQALKKIVAQIEKSM